MARVTADPVRVAVVGCGAISGAYLSAARQFGGAISIVACADLNIEAARAKAAEFGVPRACAVDEVLADPSVELVLNLTVPKAHVPVGLAAVRAGKHVYCEKPLGVTREEGWLLIDEGRRGGVRVGCAPDTFMGSGVQTARRLIDDGAIGWPVAFTAFMMGRGHESWHPSPEFYYEPGGGPMFDMGPYYLTALLNCLGPVRRVFGATSIAIPERTITSEPKRGKRIAVTTPDHVVGTVEFEGGCVGTIVTTFATMHPVYDASQPITIYGELGTVRVPDPNLFDGPVHWRREGDAEWQLVSPATPTGYGRSIGLVDMAVALRRGGGAFRASGEQGFAVLDLMQGFFDSAESGKAYEPVAAYARPAAVGPQGVVV